MSKKLKQLKVLRAQVRKIEDTYNYYEQIFLENDGVIDAEEQAQLDQLKHSTALILEKIEEQENKLKWFAKMRNRGAKKKELKQDERRSDDDIVDHSLIDPTLREKEDSTDNNNNTDNGTNQVSDTVPTATSSTSKISASVGRKGVNNESDVITVQKLLKEHGYKIKVDGNCRIKTIAAIKKFQRSKGTGKDGRIDVDGDTWKALVNTNNSSKDASSSPAKDDTTPNNTGSTPQITASVGNKGVNHKSDVITVQNLLKEHGYSISVDGACGPKTIATIKTFQRSKGTGSDGRVDVGGGTWKALVNTTTDNSSSTPSNGPLNKPNWISIAEGELGTKEIAGKEHNPRVLEYHATTGGFQTDEIPWCASFVNWVMQKAGKGGTGSGLAMSWAKYGDTIAQPAYGAIGVISYGGGKGHVGFVVGKQGGSLLLLGGNQSNMVKISKYAISKFHAFVVPSGYQVPAEAYAFGEMEGDFGPEGDFSSTR